MSYFFGWFPEHYLGSVEESGRSGHHAHMGACGHQRCHRTRVHADIAAETGSMLSYSMHVFSGECYPDRLQRRQNPKARVPQIFDVR